MLFFDIEGTLLIPLFQMSHLTEMGQLVDLITAPEDAVDLSKFSLDKCVPYVRVGLGADINSQTPLHRHL
jgi:hypothetical protein